MNKEQLHKKIEDIWQEVWRIQGRLLRVMDELVPPELEEDTPCIGELPAGMLGEPLMEVVRPANEEVVSLTN